MTDLSRRLFLRALPAAPTAVKAIAKAAVAEAATAVSTAEMANVGMSVASNSLMASSFSTYTLRDPKMYALYKAGLLPDWAKLEIADEVQQRAHSLPPNIAALRSVSTAAKYAMSREYYARKYWESIDENYLLQKAREAFWREQH